MALSAELAGLTLATPDPALAAALRLAESDIMSITRAGRITISPELDPALTIISAEGAVKVALEMV
jgi:hypothetical protein